MASQNTSIAQQDFIEKQFANPDTVLENLVQLHSMVKKMSSQAAREELEKILAPEEVVPGRFTTSIVPLPTPTQHLPQDALPTCCAIAAAI